MTKKHFEKIAKNLFVAVGSAERIDNEGESANALIILSNLIRSLEYDFADFNPNFNAEAFRKATGIHEATKELF
jgi:hypothetical protein